MDADLAKQQNPVLGYYDPIGLADIDLWGQGEEASIGEHLLPPGTAASGTPRWTALTVARRGPLLLPMPTMAALNAPATVAAANICCARPCRIVMCRLPRR